MTTSRDREEKWANWITHHLEFFSVRCSKCDSYDHIDCRTAFCLHCPCVGIWCTACNFYIATHIHWYDAPSSQTFSSMMGELWVFNKTIILVPLFLHKLLIKILNSFWELTISFTCSTAYKYFRFFLYITTFWSTANLTYIPLSFIICRCSYTQEFIQPIIDFLALIVNICRLITGTTWILWIE